MFIRCAILTILWLTFSLSPAQAQRRTETTEISSLQGLWIGRATITHVQNQLQRFKKSEDGRYLVDSKGKHLAAFKKDAEGKHLLDNAGSPIPLDDRNLNKTAQEFPLDLIIHVDTKGVTRLLSQVDLDKTRYTVVHLPLKTDIHLQGTFTIGESVTGKLNIPHDSPENPFIHTYHPDHDNLDARFEQKLNPGIESFHINRTISLTINADAGEVADPAWGTTLLTGTYTESVSGLHKEPIDVSGDFVLHKISDIATIEKR